MSKKDLKVKNLSVYRYRELKYLCLQYGEMKGEVRRACDAEKRERLEKKVKAIEQAAICADGGIYEQLLKNVTEGISFYYLAAPCDKKYFYKKRRLFFSILDEKI